MGLRLREIREGLDLTLEDVAELVDRAASTVSRHEREEGINIADLGMYCEAYGCKMADCINGTHLLSPQEKKILSSLRKLKQNQIAAVLSTMTAMAGDAEDEAETDGEVDD